MEYKNMQKRFDELDRRDLYAILALRSAVFVVEQNCVYQDIDGLDELSIHVLFKGKQGSELLAYARIIPPGLVYQGQVKIGRVVVHPDYRHKGLGRKIMHEAILSSREHFGDTPIKISAQTYLQDFYTSLGFEDTGKHYFEDGIPHMAMILD